MCNEQQSFHRLQPLRMAHVGSAGRPNSVAPPPRQRGDTPTAVAGLARLIRIAPPLEERESGTTGPVARLGDRRQLHARRAGRGLCLPCTGPAAWCRGTCVWQPPRACESITHGPPKCKRAKPPMRRNRNATAVAYRRSGNHACTQIRRGCRELLHSHRRPRGGNCPR